MAQCFLWQIVYKEPPLCCKVQWLFQKLQFTKPHGDSLSWDMISFRPCAITLDWSSPVMVPISDIFKPQNLQGCSPTTYDGRFLWNFTPSSKGGDFEIWFKRARIRNYLWSAFNEFSCTLADSNIKDLDGPIFAHFEGLISIPRSISQTTREFSNGENCESRIIKFKMEVRPFSESQDEIKVSNIFRECVSFAHIFGSLIRRGICLTCNQFIPLPWKFTATCSSGKGPLLLYIFKKSEQHSLTHYKVQICLSPCTWGDKAEGWGDEISLSCHLSH